MRSFGACMQLLQKVHYIDYVDGQLVGCALYFVSHKGKETMPEVSEAKQKRGLLLCFV